MAEDDGRMEPARPTPTSSGKPDRSLLIVLGIVAVLVVVALIVVFTRGAGAPLDASTPAGVVQRYAEAVIAGDEDAAREFLDPDLSADCLDAHQSDHTGKRVTLTGTKEHGDTADVSVTITATSGGGLLGPSEYQYDDTFQLRRAGDRWVITTASWDFTVCMEPTP